MNVLLESVFVFCLFRKAFGKRDAEGKGARFAAYLSDRCFGAYLVHVLVLGETDRLLYPAIASTDPLVSVPLVLLIVFVLSFAISELLHHIPFVKKWLV